MDYFTLSQDFSFINTVRINRDFIPENWKSEIARGRSVEFEFGKLSSRPHNFLVDNQRKNIYPDLIEAPLPLLSNRLKEVFSSFEKNIQCSCAILSDPVLRTQEIYWLFALERLECLGDGTEFYPNSTLKKLVLNRRLIGDHSVFRIHGIREKQIVIRFDVAESILRRPVVGIQLERVDCQEDL